MSDFQFKSQKVQEFSNKRKALNFMEVLPAERQLLVKTKDGFTVVYEATCWDLEAEYETLS